MFKKGEKVICTAPINPLEQDKQYTVKEYSTARVPGLEDNAFITLEEIPDQTWLAFRFKAAVENMKIIEYTGEPPTPPIIRNYHNSVDEGITQSASKNDQAKLDLSLIPYVALREEAQAFMVGEKKYGRYNYCKGHKASQLVAAMFRHISAWNEGEEHDPIDGQHHLGSVRACVAMILRQMELGTLKDDRYKK